MRDNHTNVGGRIPRCLFAQTSLLTKIDRGKTGVRPRADERHVEFMCSEYRIFWHKCVRFIGDVLCWRSRSQWPPGLRRRSAADRLLGLWVPIPPRAWTFVCCEFCVLSGRGLCDELITRPEESYQMCCVVVCDLETSWIRGPLDHWWLSRQKQTNPVDVGSNTSEMSVDCVWNVMAHAQKPNFFFRQNGRVHLYRRGRQFSRLLTAEVCASAVVMLDTPCPEVAGRVLATRSIRQFPLHFLYRVSPCAITFQLDSTLLRD